MSARPLIGVALIAVAIVAFALAPWMPRLLRAHRARRRRDG